MDYSDTKSPEDIQKEQVIDDSFSISLPIDDTDLVEYINDKVTKSRTYLKTELKLDERRKTNRDFWLGKHLDESKMDMSYQVPYIDPLIYENHETRIALAAGRMPDIF